MYIANQKEMQLLDQYTMEILGLPGIVLMENAGTSVVQEVTNDNPNKATKILVLAGSGNNGGDGFVIARRLMDFGYQVMLCLVVSEDRLKGDAKVHFDVYKSRQLPIFHYDDKQHDKFTTFVQNTDIIIDALLGTGVSGDVRAPMFEIINYVNESNKTVYAVDIPSGVNANTGEVANIAIKATKTIAFAMPKRGFFLGNGPQYIGDWKVVDISVPSDIVETLQLDLPVLLDDVTARQAVPKRLSHGHKGTFGHCLVIGGCVNYVGAPLYTAKAAFHTGVGLVSLAIPKSIYPIIASQCPESLLLPLNDEGGKFTDTALESLDLTKFKTIAFDPGIGRLEDGDILLENLFKKLTDQTVVIDADGIYFLRTRLDKVENYQGSIIVTPHPGEMATLTGLTILDIEKNRFEVAKQFTTKYGVYLLLKGHRPILATPQGQLWVNPYGNDALGKGGSGDVLTGLIASFATQGASPLEAMQAASYYHATAAEVLGKEFSNYSVTPLDVINYIAKRL